MELWKLNECFKKLQHFLGAYGTAVLYRKKDDDSLVVLKEISLLELNAIERNAAMNEVAISSFKTILKFKIKIF